jgi:hypothetical protein
MRMNVTTTTATIPKVARPTSGATSPSATGAAVRLASFFILASVFTMEGCAGTLTDPDAFLEPSEAGAVRALGTDAGTTSCPDIPTMLAQTCGIAGCHGASTKTEGLDLASPNVASRLVGVHAVEGSGLLIDPANPPASVIYTKLQPSPPFGVRMPPLNPLDAITTRCVFAWVTQVAASAPTAGGVMPADGGLAGDGSDAAR